MNFIEVIEFEFSLQLGTNAGSGSNGVISYTPNNFQQFYSSAFNPFTALYTALPSASATNPQVKYKQRKNRSKIYLIQHTNQIHNNYICISHLQMLFIQAHETMLSCW